MTKFEWYVVYQCEHGKEYNAGPYETWEEANYHYKDIVGFDSIFNVRIVSATIEEKNEIKK